MAAMYVLIGGVYALIGIPMVLFGEGETRGSGIFFLFMPFVMGAIGFVSFVFLFWVYNVIAKLFGGIEFDLEQVEQ